MKTRLLIIVAITPIILSVIVFWGFGIGTYSKYYEGIRFIHFSEDGLEKFLNETNSTKINTVKITDEDLNQAPIIRQLIQEIGTRPGSGVITVELSTSELKKYKEWIKEKKSDSLFEYDDQYYRIEFWIA